MRLVVGLFLLYSSILCASPEQAQQQMEQRIQPVGKVHIDNEQDRNTKTIPQNIPEPVAKETAGQKTYERYCVVCHRDGLVGAPKFRNEGDWSGRLSGKSIDDLLATALKGLNAMPMKGTCYECNDNDLKSAIEYMLPKS